MSRDFTLRPLRASNLRIADKLVRANYLATKNGARNLERFRAPRSGGGLSS